jgi:hypothetical protein
MPVQLDLSKAHLSRQHGDITAIYTWVNDERALVLVPTFRAGAPWYIVMDSAAHTWDDREASNVPMVAAKALKACEVLGIEPTPTNARRIAGIIIDGLPDLISMPMAPEVQYSKAAYGHHEMRANGETLMADDIRIELPQGVSYG